MSQEALKMALEALISYGKSPYIKQSHPKRWANGNKAIKALEETLAKQEQGELLYQPAALEAVDLLKFLGYVYQQTPKGLAWVNQQEQDEIVAWKHDCAALLQNNVELWVDRCPHCGKPRTTHPPQRTWVGLTAADRKEIERQSVYVDGAIRMTEAKLKQKNGFAEENT